MGALDDLKQLVFTGFLEKEVDYKGMKFSIRTLSLSEQHTVLREAGLTDPPKTVAESMAYTPVLLTYVISKVNGEAINTPELVMKLKSILSNAHNAELIRVLYEAWDELENKRNSAGEELKNSQATPNQGPIGQ